MWSAQLFFCVVCAVQQCSFLEENPAIQGRFRSGPGGCWRVIKICKYGAKPPPLSRWHRQWAIVFLQLAKMTTMLLLRSLKYTPPLFCGGRHFFSHAWFVDFSCGFFCIWFADVFTMARRCGNGELKIFNLI